MRSRRSWALGLVVAFLGFHSYLKWFSMDVSEVEGAREGKTITSFEVVTIDQRKIALATLARGSKLTIVNFWESWCGPCLKELPELQKMYAARQRSELEIVAIYRSSERASVLELMRKHALTFPVVYDEDGKVSGKFDVSAVPTTVVVDPDLKVLRSRRGYDSSLSKFVTEYLERKR